MFGLNTQCDFEFDDEYKTMEDYQKGVVRWCSGCGDSAILSATQQLCRDEQLPPEKTVFVSGIGCASRFPHYMNTYGFHGLHGRALPTAQGVKIRRPDLHVFVNMGDGDCCSIGTAHWIHAIRLNMDMVVMLHDNNIYGLTKNQASPTSPQGMKTSTTPQGTYLKEINPLSVTLGVANVSFVAQVTDWVPELLSSVIKQAFHHKGFSFIRILQRCPHFVPDVFSPLMSGPDNILLIKHANGIQVSDGIDRIYKNQEEHDPLDLIRAKELVELEDKTPVGVLYKNESMKRYDDLRKPAVPPSVEQRRELLETAFDKFGIFPEMAEEKNSGNGTGTRVR